MGIFVKFDLLLVFTTCLRVLLQWFELFLLFPNNPNSMPHAKRSCTDIKCILAKELRNLGLIVPYRSRTPYLQSLLNKRAAYVRACEDSFVGSLWSIITGSDGFWKDIKDFHFICLLSRVSKTFSYTMQIDKMAWMAVAGNHPCMSNRVMASLFLVPFKHLPKREVCMENHGGAFVQFYKYPMKARDVLLMSYGMNKGATGFYAERRWKTRRKKRRIRWPTKIIYERIWPFFIDCLLYWLRSREDFGVLSEEPTALIWHITLCNFIKRKAKVCNFLFTNKDIFGFMIFLRIRSLDYAAENSNVSLIQHVSRAGGVMWRVALRQMILFRYPHAGPGILRRGFCAPVKS